MAKLPWAIKYRPQKIKDFVFQDESQKDLIQKFIKSGEIPHLLLSGHRGTGKTSLAFLLKEELGIADEDFKSLNASDDNSVAVVRGEIQDFISTFPHGDFKIVFLDEADYMTPNAQAALRNMMEQYADNARFILTCNKINKIIPELKSRCQEMHFKTLDKDSMAMSLGKMLKAEAIKVEDVDHLFAYIDMFYPDMRKVINTVEQNCINGVLAAPDSDSTGVQDYLLSAIEAIEDDDLDAAISLFSENTSDDQWEEVYRFLYNYLHEIGKFKDKEKWKQGIVIISDHLYRHTLVADPEINFVACLIRLFQVKK